MITFYVRNVYEALEESLRESETYGVENSSRNGPVIEFPTPVTTCYSDPCERVLFIPERDANPFFHLLESIWMLVGRNDVGFLTHYVSTMINYSDDGKTFNGAYGYRWRKHFGVDQISALIERLKEDHNSRRAVIAMYDPTCDSNYNGKDTPCNTTIYFWIREGKLNMTVCNRSNDAILGAYGANAVHMSILQEYVAASVGVGVGTYYQMSNNLHFYTEMNPLYKRLIDSNFSVTEPDPYATGQVSPYPMVTPGKADNWLAEAEYFLADVELLNEGKIAVSEIISRCLAKGYTNLFFPEVLLPICIAYYKQKIRDYTGALESIELCRATDWKKACSEWIQRREISYRRRIANEQKEDKGLNNE